MPLLAYQAQAQLQVTLQPSAYHGGAYEVSTYGATDGSITTDVTGGTAPYSYVWTHSTGSGQVTGDTLPAISGLPAGWYQVVVTDSMGAQDSAAVTLTAPTQLTMMVHGTPPTCAGLNNGSASLSVAGGVLPYSYLWTHSTGSGQGTGDTLATAAGLGAGWHSITVTSADGAVRTDTFQLTGPGTLSVSISSGTGPFGYHVQCHGDTVQLQAVPSGGTPPYAYHWDTGSFHQTLKTVVGGMRWVQVTDMHNCHATDSIQVQMPDAMGLDINYLPYANGTPFSCDTCDDGIIQVSPEGGVAPYTVVWSTGLTGMLLEGMHADSAYWMTVTDMVGCVLHSDTVTVPRGVSFPQQLGVFLFAHQYAGGHHVSHAGAQDGSIEAVAVGGTPPYTYQWNTGDTLAELDSLGAGYYEVTVTDQNGVQRTRGKTLTAPAPLSAHLTGGLGGCLGNSGQLSAHPNGGTPPYQYAWSHNDSLYDGTYSQSYLAISTPGTYKTYITDANADTVSAQLQVGQAALLTTALTATEVQAGYHAICAGDTVQLHLTVEGGTAPYSYLWEHGSFQQSPQVTTGGWKRVRVSDMAGCQRDDSIHVVMPDSLMIPDDMMPHLYPNGEFFSCDTCNDGFIVLAEISGGVAPYTHMWSDGTTGDSLVGIHADSLISITVTDALGCVFHEGGVLPRGQMNTGGMWLDVYRSEFAGGYHVSCSNCANGSVKLYPGGGTPPYAVLWSDGDTSQIRNNMAGGAYEVTVTDAEGHTLVRDVELLAPGAEVLVQLNDGSQSCNGMVSGGLSVSVVGGVPPYAYQWTVGGMPLPDMWDNLNVNQTGTYRVTVTDANGQAATDSVTVGTGNALTLQVEAVLKYNDAHHVSCSTADGELTLRISGGVPPYSLNAQVQGPMGWPGPWGTSDTVLTVQGLGVGHYTLMVSDMKGCTVTAYAELRSPEGFLVTATPVELQGGHYASCDTCADVTVHVAALGAWGTVQYAWAEVPAEHTPIRLRGASLSMSEDGHDMDPSLFSGAEPMVFGTGAQQTGLKTETMYMVGAMDALGCMSRVNFTVERPHPSTGSGQVTGPPAWGLYGNDSSGAPLASEGAPWFGTADSTDVVMKANGVPQLRLGANGVTSVEGQLRLAQVPNSLAEARLLMINPDGSIAAYESAPGVSWPPPVSDGSCYGDGLDGPMQGVWDPGINKLTTCPQINVGIGVQNPAYKLHVNGAGRISGNLISSSMNSTRLNLDNDANSVSTGNRLYVKASSGTDALLVEDKDGNPALTVLKGGNVGIGTATPQSRLDVRDGNGSPALRVFNDGKVVAGAEALRVHPDDAVTVGPHLTESASSATLYLGDDRNHSIRAHWGQGLRFGTYGVDNAMLIEDVTGTVSIGQQRITSGPHTDYRLSVDGKIVAKEFVVTKDVNYWSDYVFEKDYRLRSICEVEEYITEYGHLPDVPSAQEVKQQGQDLGRMDAILLRKIEELTLYIIELERRLDEKCGN